MAFEILLVAGCLLSVLSVISVISALIDGHRPRVAALVAVMSVGLIIGASAVAEDGLRLDDVPNAFVSIVARIMK